MGNYLQTANSIDNYTEQHDYYMLVSQQLNDMSQLNLRDRENGMTILCKIFKNILNDPTNTKYHDINLYRMSKKLKYNSFTELLIISGFNKSSDSKRLLFDTTQFHTLKGVHKVLLKYKSLHNYTTGQNPLPSHISHDRYHLTSLFKPTVNYLINQFNIYNEAQQYEDNCEAKQEPVDSNPPTLLSHNICKEYMYSNASDALKDLKHEMNTKFDNIDVHKLLNCHLYLLQNYNTDDQFEHIYDSLGGYCDLKKCIKFTRNTRNRCNERQCLKELYDIDCDPDSYDIVKHEIIDKIHCFYHHTFDVGYRLCAAERNALTNVEAKDDNDDHELFINTQILQINEIISNKRKDFVASNSRKFNQCEPEILMAANKAYSFGKQFKYSQHPWSDEKVCRHIQILSIKAKFKSLKEEMILNDLFRINIEQFNNEYNKALLHFVSLYCRENIQPLYQHWELKCEHILSLMIYCNYDALQYCFSNTYRESMDDHCKFYYLGYYLKVAIHIFGKPIAMHPTKKQFYHGISNKYYFPAYDRCFVFGPLSTSISFEVAVAFTNQNQGLIVEFGDSDSSYASAVYFDVCWVSDFGNEKEHLFIQNAYAVRIKNITEASTGTEYQFILLALQIFGHIMYLKADKYKDLPQNYCALIDLMIQHQLARYLPHQYKIFESLTGYGSNLIDTYFQNQTAIDVSYQEMKKFHTLIFNVLFDGESECIKLDVVNILYPKLELLTIRNIKLCDKILTLLFDHCRKNDCKLNWITIHPRKVKNGLSVKQAIIAYKHQFKSINFVCFEAEEMIIVREHSKAYQMLVILYSDQL